MYNLLKLYGHFSPSYSGVIVIFIDKFRLVLSRNKIKEFNPFYLLISSLQK